MSRALQSIAAVLLAFASLTPPARAGEAEPPFRDLAFDDAAALAGEQGKAVMIDFFTTWCGPCKRLDAETWADPSVQAWLDERTVPLKLDAEIETDLAKRYAVRGYPTILFIDSNGEEIERLIGFLPPHDFIEQAALILDAGSADALIDRRRELAYESGAPARLEFVKLLMRHDRDDEALAELIWCYDIGMGEGSVFRGSRNSRVLDEFARLAERSMPARNELNRRAIDLLRKAAGNQADERELIDVAALNAAIDRQDRTLELINIIERNAPDSPALNTLYLACFDDLLSAKRYDALAKRFPPFKQLLESEGRWATAERRVSAQPDDKREERRANEARRETGALVNAYEIALGTNDEKLAAALESRILEIAPEDWAPRHRLAIATHRAAGPTPAALAHAAAAVERLANDDEANTVSPIITFARILADAGRTDEATDLLTSTLNRTTDADQRDALREAIDEIEAR